MASSIGIRDRKCESGHPPRDEGMGNLNCSKGGEKVIQNSKNGKEDMDDLCEKMENLNCYSADGKDQSQSGKGANSGVQRQSSVPESRESMENMTSDNPKAPPRKRQNKPVTGDTVLEGAVSMKDLYVPSYANFKMEWKSFTITYHYGRRQKIQNAFAWSPCYMQFLCLYHLDSLTKGIPHNGKAEVNEKDKMLSIYLPDDCIKRLDDIQRNMEGVLAKLCETLLIHKLSSEEFNVVQEESLIKKMQSDGNKKLDLELFQQTENSYIVVGFGKAVKDILEKLKICIGEIQNRTMVMKRRIPVDSRAHLDLLKKLDFWGSLLKRVTSLQSIQMKYDDTGCCIICHCNQIQMEQIDSESHRFLSDVSSEEINLQSYSLKMSLLKKTEVQEFLEKQLDSYGVCAFLTLKGTKLYIYAEKRDLQKAVRAVKDSLVLKEVKIDDEDYFFYTTPTFLELKKLALGSTLLVERRPSSICICATKFIDEYITKGIQKLKNITYLPLTPVQCKAIDKWNLVAPIRKKYPNCKIEVLPDFDKAVFQNDQGNEGMACLKKRMIDLYAIGTSVYINTKLLEGKVCRNFLDAKLEKLKICWEVETENSVEVLSCSKEDTKEAVEIFNTSICMSIFLFTDKFEEKIMSNEFKKMEEQCHGKFFIDCKEDDRILYATCDIFEEVENFLSKDIHEQEPPVWNPQHLKAKQLCKGGHKTTDEVLDYLQIWEDQFLNDIKNKYNVEMDLVAKYGISIKGSKASVEKAVKEIEDFLLKSVWKTDVILWNPKCHDLVENNDFEKKKKEFMKQYKCQISKRIAEPKLGDCWVPKTDSPNFYRVFHVVGHAELLNTDFLLCPCSSVMAPLNSCFWEAGGEFLIELLHKSGKKECSHRTLGHSEVISCSEHFQFEKIQFLSVFSNRDGKHLSIKEIIDTTLKNADELKMKSVTIPLVLLPPAIVNEEKQAVKIAQTMKKPPALSHVEEVYLCDCNDKFPEKIRNILKEELGRKTATYIKFSKIKESNITWNMPCFQINNPIKSQLGQILVSVEEGSLVSQKVDVLVNTIGTDLDLSKGQVSKTISQKGGDQIQKELDSNYPNGINFTEVAVTKGGGSLFCKYIFHGALTEWPQVGNFSIKVLKLFIWNCLMEADKLECKSLAFPSLGTGKLQYPWRVVGETFFDTVQKYEEVHKDTGIKHIRLTVFHKDHNSLREFKAVEKLSRIPTSDLQNDFPQCLSQKWLDTSNPIFVHLLPQVIEWRWGSLLKIIFDNERADKVGEWVDDDDCFHMHIRLPGSWSFSIPGMRQDPLISFLTEKRISTVQLLLQNTGSSQTTTVYDTFAKEIDHIKTSLKSSKDHFVQHLMIVFPSQPDFDYYKQYRIEAGKWRTTRKSLPIALKIISNATDGPKVEGILKKFVQKQEQPLAAKRDPEQPTVIGRQNSETASSLSGWVILESPIFETVTGKIHCLQGSGSRTSIQKIVREAGCTPISEDFNTISIEGEFSAVLKVNEKLKEIQGTSGTEREAISVDLKMTDIEFAAFQHFGHKQEWYKKVGNALLLKDGKVSAVVGSERLKNDIEKHLNNVKMMNTDAYEIQDPDSKQNVDSEKVEAVFQDIQQQYKDVCFVLKDDKIVITSSNYEKIQEVKMQIKQKISGKVPRRRARQFAEGHPENSPSTSSKELTTSINPSRRNRFQKKTDDSSRDFSQSVASTSVSGTEMKTAEGITIKVYQGSILRVDVECIVNAANDRLMHGGGVAAAISEAAGYGFDRESADYIAKHGPIPVGRCCITSAGKLPYKCVIHTVGPRWGDYSDEYKQACLDDLQEAVEVTFREADKQKLTSLAIPAISSGIFGVPKEGCVEQYYKAVVTFSSSYSHSNLKEIHFVDRDSTMVNLIQSNFSKSLQNDQNAATSKNISNLLGDDSRSNKADISFTTKQLSTAKHLLDKDDMTIFKLENNFILSFFIGDISIAKAKAVICPQDIRCCSSGTVAKLILKSTTDPSAAKPPEGNEYKMCDVIVVPIQKSNKVNWEYILHAVSPRWNREATKGNQKFEKDLKQSIFNILRDSERNKISSIAMPLLGAVENWQRKSELTEEQTNRQGTVETNSTPLETCANAFAKSVKQFSEIRTSYFLEEVNVVFTAKSDMYAYTDAMKTEGFEVHILSLPSSPQGKASVKSLKFSSTVSAVEDKGEDENCCICMETPTKPKKLEKCGHIFCTDCIEQYFQYKPVCPNCGQLYGKMTGDQPPGTMTIKKLYSTKLPGYHYADGSILVTYKFPDGSQSNDHPSPGQRYKGIERSGYVPNIEKGRQVVKLLNVAFSRKLMFTIGRSRTTGHDGVITWNDIHHKTRIDGGPQRFGYPDDTYLDRVMEEMAVKGVTPESADDEEEYKEYKSCFRHSYV